MATIHHLPLQGQDPSVRDPSKTATTPPANPLVEELKKATLGVLGSMLEKMFGRADDALFEMGERAQSDAERRRYFDAMRVLRLGQGKISRQFLDEIERSFSHAEVVRPSGDGTAIDFDSLSIQPTEELEERIAVTNLVARAEGMHKQLIWDVERRLDFASTQLGVPVSPQALAPSRICEAFGTSLRNLDAEFEVKLIIYKLFEREVVRDLHRAYEAALDLLDRQGVNPARPRVAQPQQPAPRMPVGGMGGGQTPIDPRMLQLLRGFAAQSPRPDTDTQLAAELATALRDALSGSYQAASVQEAQIQRLSLANQYFDGLLAEPLLPESARPMIEKLRFPVIKTALADPGFFSNSQHPLRQLLGELLDMAISGSIGDTVPQSRLRDSIRQVLERADIDAGTVRNHLHDMKPLGGNEMDQFLDQMREQEHSRRELLLTKVRRLVAQELEVQTIGRDVPPPAQNLLLSGIGPLMAVRLLRHGRSSGQYREAHDMLERILDSLDPVVPDEDRLVSRRALCDAIAAALTGIGMRRERIEELITGLMDAYDALDQRAREAEDAARQKMEAEAQQPAPAPVPEKQESLLPTVTVMELLSRILAPESWFRVYDPDRNITRWLKLASFYANQDSVTFSGFDEGIKLTLRANRFAEDLADGRSEPINPDNRAREALEQLRRAKSAGLF